MKPPRPQLTLALGAVLFVACTSLFPAAANADLFWTTGVPEAIGRAELGGDGVVPTFIDLEAEEGEPFGIAVDSEHVYWTNFDGAAIGRALLDGSDIEPNFIPLPAGGNIVNLAVDSSHIYWVNGADVSIGRADIDGTHVDNSFITPEKREEFAPGDIAVDADHLYWTDGVRESIGRSNLDGSGIEWEFVQHVGNAWSLDVDSNHIYWTNRGLKAISRADIDGTGVDLSYIPLVAEPFGIAVDGFHVYWTNNAHGFEDGRVGRAELDGGNVEEAFVAGPLGEYMGSITAELGAVAQVSPASLLFGSPTPVPEGSLSPSQTVTYSNEGNEPLTIAGFTITGADSDEFQTGTDTCRVALAPGRSCKLQIRFAPLAAGSAAAVLTAVTNATEDPTTALSGIASAAAVPPVGPPGPTGATGAAGETGSAGGTGSVGAAGPAGARGKAGARGRAGRDAKVTCTVRRKGPGSGTVKVTCKVKLATKKKAKAGARVAWRLTRGRHTVAHGIALARHGRFRLMLAGAERLRPGRYVLRLPGRGPATPFVVR